VIGKAIKPIIVLYRLTREVMTRQPSLRTAVILPKGRFMKLLVLVLGMFVLVPILEELFQVQALGELFFFAIVCYATYSFNHNKRFLAAAITLAVPAIASMWLRPFVQIRWLPVSGDLCGIVFIALVTTAILVHIFRQEVIDADIIAGAIVAYLLMALMWSKLYGVLEDAHFGSFQFPQGTTHSGREVFTYFSFATITTVGYGDIVPVTTVARASANIEAVVGQLYLVILVSWLVGMHVSARSRR
jgi:voltage-gated potassium channel